MGETKKCCSLVQAFSSCEFTGSNAGIRQSQWHTDRTPVCCSLDREIHPIAIHRIEQRLYDYSGTASWYRAETQPYHPSISLTWECSRTCDSGERSVLSASRDNLPAYLLQQVFVHENVFFSSGSRSCVHLIPFFCPADVPPLTKDHVPAPKINQQTSSRFSRPPAVCLYSNCESPIKLTSYANVSWWAPAG